jgi:hypothetical protein
MKNLVCLILYLAVSQSINAQDTLFLRNKEKSIVKVKEIGPSEISFIRFDYLDGPIYRVYKTNVDKIFFQNGLKEYFNLDTLKLVAKEVNTEAKKEEKKASFEDGQNDAQRYYKGYKGAGTGSYFAGLFFTYGLPVPIVTSLTRPTNASYYAPDRNLYMNNPQYAMGFNKRAYRMKASKAWENFGFGALTTTGIFVAVFIVALSQFAK